MRNIIILVLMVFSVCLFGQSGLPTAPTTASALVYQTQAAIKTGATGNTVTFTGLTDATAITFIN